MTCVPVSGANSEEFASFIPAILRAASITMHCSPKHRPKVGILFSRANVRAPSLPSIPRTPKPPGTHTASTSLKASRAPSGVAQSSLAIHFSSTFALFANPPARSASETDR